MEQIFKSVNLLYIIHGDSILMRKFMLQDREVIDVFAFKDSGNINGDIEGKLMSLFGKTFPHSFCGNIESVIHKKGATVHLAIRAYRVMLDGKYEVLDGYTDDVVHSGDSTLWLDRNAISSEKRLREGDKKILKRVFDDRNMDIRMTEEQGDEWIDATVTLFEDK